MEGNGKYHDFTTVNDEMNRNLLRDKFSQLSPKGLGYMILQLPPDLVGLIDKDLLSILKSMGNSTDASDVFGRFIGTRENVLKSASRKSVVFKHSPSLLKDIESVLRNLEGREVTRTDVKKVKTFLDAFSCFLKEQRFYKDMKKHYKAKDSDMIMMFSVMITMQKNVDQASHFDFNPEGNCLLIFTVKKII